MERNAQQKLAAVEDVIAKEVRLYDNGGKTLDRYTAVYMYEPEKKGLFGARGMNASPFHGIGSCCSAAPGRHLGRRVAISDLPEDCQRVVRMDVGSYLQSVEA
ncbi:hypothetical protein [Ralstonia pseudosolanacearum]|uniref:hypothetical protein n=1 Tax=Ralstonia pseudosolanacearum TaxID=1310165 RepID=UPI003CEBDC8A